MKKTDTLFLTGLRGYSALAVFLIHSGGAGLRTFGGLANKIVDFGKYGVISFFVLSAFTLSMSIKRTERFSFAHYFSRRFARIFPVYFIVVTICWWLGGADYYLDIFKVSKHDFFDLSSHLLFINVWDVRYKNTIIGVEWTVPIEMWIYLTIPMVYFFIVKNRSMGWALLFFSLVISVENYRWHQDGLAAHWAIETYFYCFVAGVIAYGFIDSSNLSEKNADISVLILIISIGAVCVVGDYLSVKWQVFLSMLSPRLVYVGGGNLTEQLLTLLVALLVIALSHANLSRILFENKAVIFLGNICFPFYLLHVPVISFLSKFQIGPFLVFVFGLILTSAIAYGFHLLIERPALKFTGKLHPYDI